MSRVLLALLVFAMWTASIALAEGHGSNEGDSDASRPAASGESTIQWDSRPQLQLPTGKMAEGSLSDVEAMIQRMQAELATVLETQSN